MCEKEFLVIGYEPLIRRLIAGSTDSFRAAQNDDQRREVVAECLRRGFAIGATFGELMDFFYVSTPSILESAGITEDRTDLLAAFFDQEHNKLGYR